MLGTLKRHRKATVIVAALASMTIAGSAFAYWTGSGAGSGGATVASSALPIVVNLTAPVTPVLPGNPAQELSGTFTNPNSAAVMISTLNITMQPGWTARADAGKRACDASDFVIYGDMGADMPLKIDKLVSTGTTWGGATLAMNLKPAGNTPVNSVTDNQDNCKGVTVPLIFTAS